MFALEFHHVNKDQFDQVWTSVQLGDQAPRGGARQFLGRLPL
jgi:hypothetical protein